MSFFDDLKTWLQAGQRVFLVETWEEERLENYLQKIFPRHHFYTWNITRGLKGPEGPLSSGDPAEGVLSLLKVDPPFVAHFVDIHPFLKPDNPLLLRAMKDFSLTFKGKPAYLFCSTPYAMIPDELRHHMELLTFPLPDEDTLLPLVEKRLKTMEIEPDATLLEAGGAILKGLTYQEAQLALLRVQLQCPPGDKEGFLRHLLNEKIERVKARGVLEPIPLSHGEESIGGMDNLKAWFRQRKLFVQAYLRGQAEVMPRGVLLMGVSGCGKSLAIKAIADIWKLPLFKLDMNLVFSGSFGAPEKVFHDALQFMESVAPAVLWLDEIEMGISAQADTGTAARVFAHFLTWMQERKTLVFVAATANRIDLLPAELIRRGRFDQIFFVDLPTEEERKAIFQVHLQRLHQDISQFDFVILAQATKDFSGAEIEQCVTAAYASAVAQNKPLTQDDLYWEIHNIIPLATTMQEQIKALRSWAHRRAVPASKTR